MEKWLHQVNPQIHTVWHGEWRAGILEAPRLLPDHELVVVARGRCVVEVGTERVVCQGPYFIIVPPTCWHASLAQSETFRYCVHFDWQPQRDAAPERFYYFLPDTPPPAEICLAPAWVPPGLLHGPIDPASPVLTLVQSLATRWLEDGALSRVTCRALLLEILLRLLTDTTSVVPTQQVRRDRRTSLAMEIKQRLDFMELGGGGVQQQLCSLGYRYEHLSRVFKQAFGLPPLRYWENVRLEKAKRLLASGERSVKEVAQELQFHDTTYFCRVFKRQTGFSPRAWSRRRNDLVKQTQ